MKKRITFANIKNLIENYPQSNTDTMVSLVKVGIRQGWYLNEFFLFALLQRNKSGSNLNSFIEQEITSEWETFWKIIFNLVPARKDLLNEAKQAFESGLYGAAIHIFFSQTDGIFHEKFSINFYSSGLAKAQSQFNLYLTEFIERNSFAALIEQFKDASLFRRMHNEVYKEGFDITHTDLVQETSSILNEYNLVIPNRHGVLHGIHKNYGTKQNALKCFSLLLFVIFAINGDKIYESF